MLKKTSSFIFSLSMILLFSVTLYSEGQKGGNGDIPRFIEIGTAGTGGAYYPIGIAMAEILTEKLDTQATAQVTGGAVDNIRLIQEGSVKIAITSNASAYRGLNGLSPFSEPNPRISGLFSNLTQGIYQIAVPKNSDIKDFYDLKGKRVSLGPQGGLGVEISKYAFEAAGFSIDDVTATFLSYGESATMLSDGNLDAIIIQAAMPSPALKQLKETGKDFRLIPVPADVIDKVNLVHPYYSSFTIPAAVYGTDSDIKTLKSTNMVVVDAKLSEETVYQILKALLEDPTKISDSHPAARAFKLETAADMPIPLHPGAERYYRENNLLEQ